MAQKKIDEIRNALALLNNQQAATAAWRAASLESDCAQDANSAIKLIRDRNADIQRLNEALRKEEKAEVEKLLAEPIADTIVKNGITYKRQDPKKQRKIWAGALIGAMLGGIIMATGKEAE